MSFDVKLDATLKKDLVISEGRCDFRISDLAVGEDEYKHITKDYEILAVTDGAGILKHGSVTYDVSAGSVFFFHDGESYSAHANSAGFSAKVIGFSNCFYFPFNERTVSFFDIPYVKRKIYTKIEGAEFEHFKYILSTLESHSMFFTSYNRFTLITAINFILLHYMVITDGTAVHVNYQDSVGRAIRYIYDMFKSSDFTIGELAEKLHFTPTYLSKLFRKEMGTTPQLYLLNVRLEYAADLLLGNDLSIAEVAADSGFNSTAYFIKQFKNKYGTTPKKYARDMNFFSMPQQ